MPTNDIAAGSYKWALRTLGLRYDTDLFFRRVEYNPRVRPYGGISSIDEVFNLNDIWIGDI